MSKSVLVTGHRSFAGNGLASQVRERGHGVTCFSRGSESSSKGVVCGPVLNLKDNRHLTRSFDVVVNFLLLKGHGIAENVEYVDGLLDFCAAREVSHLVHISSISVFAGGEGHVIDEQTRVQTDPQGKGSYGAVKVATEERLVSRRPSGMRLSLVYPGFILGSGLADAIPGIGLKLPWNQILGIGSKDARIPLVSREAVHNAIVSLVELDVSSGVARYILVSPDSPSRQEYLEACCRLAGLGTRARHLPPSVWLTAGTSIQVAAKLAGKSVQVLSKIESACEVVRFNATSTAEALNLDLRMDWRAVLEESVTPTKVPHAPFVQPSYRRLGDQSVSFLGFGRIVRTKHIPALLALKHTGQIRAFDLNDQPSATVGVNVEPVPDLLPDADIWVIATPGHSRTRLASQMDGITGTVLFEKPLSQNREELVRWIDFSERRSAPTMVCHNYRFKSNVLKMVRFLAEYGSGPLQQVHLHFDSPPVSSDSAAWATRERASRTLLFDYSIHFLDLAFMLADSEPSDLDVQYRLNHRGETALIEGHWRAGETGYSFLLRQGVGRRKASVIFSFRNYDLKLGFFPDTFDVVMVNATPVHPFLEALNMTRSSVLKVWDKVSGGDHDLSHLLTYASLADGGPDHHLSVQRLSGFYGLLCDLGERVYDA